MKAIPAARPQAIPWPRKICQYFVAEAKPNMLHAAELARWAKTGRERDAPGCVEQYCRAQQVLDVACIERLACQDRARQDHR